MIDVIVDLIYSLVKGFVLFAWYSAVAIGLGLLLYNIVGIEMDIAILISTMIMGIIILTKSINSAKDEILAKIDLRGDELH